MIDEARETSGSWKGMREPLQEALSKLEPHEIVHWQRIFNEYQRLSYKDKLWAAAAVMMNGCSDDSFDYFRAWLTAQVKEVFLRALAEPDSLADLAAVQALGREVLNLVYTPPNGYENEPRFAGLLYAAYDAYDNRPGTIDFYDALESGSLSEREKTHISGEIVYAADIDAKWFAWDVPREETDTRLQSLCPRLCMMFHEGIFPEVGTRSQTPEKPAAAESVVKKLREGRNAIPPREPKEKKHGKSGSER